MSLQQIINTAASIEMSRERIVSTTISRSQRVKISERNASAPWRWTVTPRAYFKWSDSRELIESLDYLDRNVESQINLSVSGLSNIGSYRGQLSDTQRANLLITSFTGQSLILNNLPSIGAALPGGGTVSSTTVMFSPGDFIQPANSRYPYTIINTVLRGSGTSVTVSTNRPLITSEGISVANQNIYVGSLVSWRFLIMKRPSYIILPRDRMQFTGDFELLERII
jgi:hypothetical protein